MGKKVCIVGRSNIVGMPLSLLLAKQDCCVAVCHSKTPLDELITQVQKADIVVACCGDAEFIQASWVKQDAIIIDVGIT